MRFSTVFVLLALVAVVGFVYIGYREPSFGQQVVLEIDAPVEHTFAVFSDQEQLASWVTGFRKIEYLRGEEGQPGSYYRITVVEDGREFVMTEQITAFVENEHFGAEFENDMMTSKYDYWFEDRNGSTSLQVNSEHAGRGPFWRSVLWFMKADIQAQQKADLEKFKRLVESAAPVLN